MSGDENSPDLFEEAVSGLGCLEELSDDGTPGHSSGVSGRSIELTENVAASSGTFRCETCKKVLKTQTGFQKHRILHRINDANSRKPDFDDVAPIVDPLMREIFQGILEEGCDQHMKNFVDGVLSAEPSSEWFQFVAAVADPILNFVCEKTKLLPFNQYEDQLKNLNALLNDDDSFQRLECQLRLLNTNVEIASGSRMLFKIVHELYEKLQLFVFENMRIPSVVDCGENVGTSSISLVSFCYESCSEGFKIHMKKMLRAVYLKCLEINTPRWAKRGLCILQNFVTCRDDEPCTSEKFLSNNSWDSDESGDSFLKLSINCLHFLFYVDQLLKQCKTLGEMTADNIIESLFKPENRSALDLWGNLTEGYFSESECYMFMKDIVGTLVFLCTRLEVEKQRALKDNERRKQAHALRSRLQS